MKNIGDVDLVIMVKEGNRLAFSELVVRHQKPLYLFLLKYLRSEELAEDIVQDAFIRAYTKIEGFEQRAAFKSWLYRIALNLAKNRMRSNKRINYSLENVKIGELAEAENALVYEAIQKRVKDEIDLLPSRQKEALHLRIFEDLAFKEIAEVMGCPYDTAKANYRHALMKLKEVFSQEESFREWLSVIDQELGVLEMKLGVES